MKYELLSKGLSAPICLTWEITNDCNLRCRHCLSSSGDPTAGELSLPAAWRLIDELAEMGVFYINIGGGEPFCRSDLFEIAEHAISKDLPLQISTNGTIVTADLARRLAELPSVYLQVSLDGASPKTNDEIRGQGCYGRVVRSMELLAEYGIDFVVNCVLTRSNLGELDALYQLAKSHGAMLRISRLRPTGRARECWTSLHPTREQHIRFYHWLKKHPDVLTGDSFFFLSALGEPMRGLNMCGAGRVTCGITPTGEVYPCPFLVSDKFLAGNVREQPFPLIWSDSRVFRQLRTIPMISCHGCLASSPCRGGCLAVKYYLSGSLEGMDPECVLQVRR